MIEYGILNIKEGVISLHKRSHHSDVAWASKHLTSPAFRPFVVQLIVQASNEENTKAPHHWPFVIGIQGSPVNSSNKGWLYGALVFWKHHWSLCDGYVVTGLYNPGMTKSYQCWIEFYSHKKIRCWILRFITKATRECWQVRG